MKREIGHPQQSPPEAPGGGGGPRRSRGLLGGLAARGIETVFAIGMVLVFFLACLGVLFLGFPKGIGLGDLVRYEQMAEESRPAIDLGSEGWQTIVGMLANVQRSVKSKPSDSIVWSSASRGQRLGDRDAVQTYQSSGATIDFDGASELRLGENSMVVVRRVERQAGTGARRASVVLLGGELAGRVAPGASGRSTVEVVSGHGAARVAAPGHGSAEFRVSASVDQSSTFAVYRGEATVSAGGRTVVLTADHAVRVEASGELGRPVRLAPAPEPSLPAMDQVVACRRLPAEISFSWAVREQEQGYRLVIARDPDFRTVVLDKRLGLPRFTHGNLQAGHYFWRVSASTEGFEGAPSGARSFDVLHDTEPPVLRVDPPEHPLVDRRWIVRGVTEPGVRVFIGQQEVPVGVEGEFERSVELREGASVVVIEAVDAAGNVTYQSALVSADD